MIVEPAWTNWQLKDLTEESEEGVAEGEWR